MEPAGRKKTPPPLPGHLLALGSAASVTASRADPHPLAAGGGAAVSQPASQPARHTQTDGQADRSGWEGGWERREILGLKWKTSFFLFSFFVPLFPNVETTQCEEEDGSRQDAKRQRDGRAVYPPPDLEEKRKKPF